MGRYSDAQLEGKFAWMRERQRERQEQERETSVAPPVASEPPEMLRVKQVAKILGVSISSVERWFANRCVLVRGRRRNTILIPRKALDDWIREHAVS